MVDTEKWGLSAVLGDRDIAAFLRTSWEREALLLHGAAVPLVGRLFTLADFERLACGGGAELSVVQNGQARPVVADRADRVPGRHVLAAYRSGATLLLSCLPSRCPPVGELCRGIEFDLLRLGLLPGDPVSANAYLTPPRAQGFGRHHDDHSVLVVQLHGSKRWEVFGPGSQGPEAVVSATLEAGDVLSIPAGFPHVAHTTDEASLHLTIGLHTLSWADALADMLRAHEPFRRSVTGPDTAGSTLPGLPELDVPGYLRSRRIRWIAGLDPLPGGQLLADAAAATVEADTLVGRVPLMPSESGSENGLARLTFPGGTLRLDGRLQPVIDYVAKAESFVPRQLPAVGADYDAVELTRILVRHHIFHPVEKAAGPEPAVPAAIPAARETAAAQEPVPAAVRTRDLTLVRDKGPAAGHHLGWMRLREPLSAAECDDLVAACRELPLTAPTTVDETGHPSHRRAQMRHVPKGPRTAWVYRLVEEVAREAARTVYGFDLTGITRAPQYVEYLPGNGHFHRHNDYSHDQLDSPRKITVIVQLSDPASYQGGALRMFGVETEELPRERGSVLVFPSLIDHCVTPVTEGLRRALVAWVAGPRLR
ncbi:JmjC domain-containing protein [Streptantibioticus cattleyicolor]|uniref:Oxidoreductase domain-containing protein n=1 Tax=Streptantibioticus cattleyicolor (strain ATCC 35852 / DSM 46488 / JCM 4925 / NBRC 14057 / NRRL 8057) TaxID=1003195 RepID=G8XH57_STREN|nr:cupin domain-containing protein [Streptantibioticus cattleyicolor]AEW99775.1 oxidoreductase domain-containing protein [Streptantibioticus cattleyicolor NRRL 8057 = DSM 46488]